MKTFLQYRFQFTWISSTTGTVQSNRTRWWILIGYTFCYCLHFLVIIWIHIIVVTDTSSSTGVSDSYHIFSYMRFFHSVISAKCGPSTVHAHFHSFIFLSISLFNIVIKMILKEIKFGIIFTAFDIL